MTLRRDTRFLYSGSAKKQPDAVSAAVRAHRLAALIESGLKRAAGIPDRYWDYETRDLIKQRGQGVGDRTIDRGKVLFGHQ